MSSYANCKDEVINFDGVRIVQADGHLEALSDGRCRRWIDVNARAVCDVEIEAEIGLIHDGDRSAGARHRNDDSGTRPDLKGPVHGDLRGREGHCAHARRERVERDHSERPVLKRSDEPGRNTLYPLPGRAGVARREEGG